MAAQLPPDREDYTQHPAALKALIMDAYFAGYITQLEAVWLIIIYGLRHE